ncbi:CvpA family protein [gamma proteobacterium HTCC5015]|nr:CvpA family protein [gamma proteobacterium HTCC5015]
MHWVDVAIVVVIVLSLAIALFRGFVKEAISLASWVAASWISLHFAPKLAPLWPEAIAGDWLRQGLALIVLFIATMIVGGLVSFIVTSLVEKTGLSHTDRALGGLFGLIRGVVIVCALVLFGAFVELTRADWWQQAVLLPYFQALSEWVISLLPSDVAAKFVFP